MNSRDLPYHVIYALRGVEHDTLWNAVSAMLVYLWCQDDPDIATAIDILTQLAYTGEYEIIEDTDDDDEGEPVDVRTLFVTPEMPITEDEINRFVQIMNGEEPDDE